MSGTGSISTTDPAPSSKVEVSIVGVVIGVMVTATVILVVAVVGVLCWKVGER